MDFFLQMFSTFVRKTAFPCSNYLTANFTSVVVFLFYVSPILKWPKYVSLQTAAGLNLYDCICQFRAGLDLLHTRSNFLIQPAKYWIVLCKTINIVGCWWPYKLMVGDLIFWRRHLSHRASPSPARALATLCFWNTPIILGHTAGCLIHAFPWPNTAQILRYPFILSVPRLWSEGFFTFSPILGAQRLLVSTWWSHLISPIVSLALNVGPKS